MRVSRKDTGPRRWKLKETDYVVPERHTHPDHPSKTRRKYKVRFHVDIKRARKNRQANDVDRPSEGDDPTSRGKAAGIQSVSSESRYNLVEDTPGDDLNHDPITWSDQSLAPDLDHEVAALQDASLLYAFSTEQRQMDPADSIGASFCDLEGIAIDPDELLEDTSTTDNQETSPLRIHGTSISSVTASSPLLNFQNDILPNIPRELPYPPTWLKSPTSDRRFYLQYYIEKVVPRLMPLWNTADNPFICIVVPLSTESQILTHAIIALSAYHRSIESGNIEGNSKDDLEQSPETLKALRHKQKVLTLLQENLTKPDLLRDEATLAACMLMQTFEVLLSGTSGWDHWQRGAALFIKLRGKLESDLMDSNSWMRLAKCVVAVETFAATSTRFELLISEEYWNVYRRLRRDDLQQMSSGKISGLNENAEDEHFEKLIGCPVVVVYSLGRMVMLIQSREETEATETIQNDFDWYSTWSVEALKLEDLLLRWTPKESGSDKAHLGEAFRHAALVFYFRKIRRLQYLHETIQYHVQRTFDHLLSLSPVSKIEGIALWPTMIAAIEIDEMKQPNLTDLTIERIRGMSFHARDPLYRNAENALTLLWSKRRRAKTWEERIAINWDDLSREMGWNWCMV